MKVCLGQINTTPGDFAGNLAAILKGIDVADTADCDAVIFPELTIPGYLSQDLIYHPSFIQKNLDVLQEIIRYSIGCRPGLHIVVGYIEVNEGVGKPFFNMAGCIRGGELIGSYVKQLLPFYDVFDELRYFEPGDDLLLLDIAGQRTGFTICEDLWNDKGSDDYNYEANPMQQYRAAGVDVVFSLNSSPYVHGKPQRRFEIIGPGTLPDITVVYVNQRGGQDELVFDGHSFVMGGGELKHVVEEVHEDTYEVVDLSRSAGRKGNGLRRSDRILEDLLVLGLRDYVVKSGFSELVLASSGGVDSAVVCKLACDAVGADHVHAIRMPSVYSSDHSRDDARTLHANLGCWDYEVDIDHQAVVAMLNERYTVHRLAPGNLVTRKMPDGYAAVADENIQARMRDLYVMHFSNAFGAMPLSTGNKTESACGYYTHFDMNFSYAPIKDLYKFQVMQLARNSPEIPANIWQKPPSAELAEGQTDEASLLPYAVLDPIAQAYVEEYISGFKEFSAWVRQCLADNIVMSSDAEVLTAWLSLDGAEGEFKRIIGLIGRMEYKRRQTCPGTKVSRVAFGIGRRIPIVEKWS